jgi:undecaprenyl diphosphate synthase
MDGNGRWAEQRGRRRTDGHRRGAERVDEIATACADRGIRFLTLFAFSTENWRRPPTEIALLMRLLIEHLRSMDQKLKKNRIRLEAKGSLERLPRLVRTELERVLAYTADPSPRMTMTLCLSYGGRQEIVDAAKKVARAVQAGTLGVDQIDEAHFSAAMYQPAVPDPDLLIRTGGEYRISNFLLWQAAYAEIFTSPVLWPDFDAQALEEALRAFGARERRFGKTGAQVRPPAFSSLEDSHLTRSSATESAAPTVPVAPGGEA